MWPNWLKFERVIFLILIILVIGLSWRNLYLHNLNEERISHMVSIVQKDNAIEIVDKDKNLEELKKTNKDLYDSIKIYKDQVAYLIQFKYKKDYDSGKIQITEPTDTTQEAQEFTYSNEPTDSINYTLTIGSTIQPLWYSLRFSVTDQFTIVNKKDGEFNITDIESNGEIFEPTIVNVKRKNRDYLSLEPMMSISYSPIKNDMEYNLGISARYKHDNFKIGPMVTVGANSERNNVDVRVGFSVTYDLLGK